MNRNDVDAITLDQKLKLLQLSLHYVLPKLRSTKTIEKKFEDEWKDSFEVPESYTQENKKW